MNANNGHERESHFDNESPQKNKINSCTTARVPEEHEVKHGFVAGGGEEKQWEGINPNFQNMQVEAAFPQRPCSALSSHLRSAVTATRTSTLYCYRQQVLWPFQCLILQN